MIPTIVEFRETMPKTAAGKIDKLELAEQEVGGTTMNTPVVFSADALRLDAGACGGSDRRRDS